jgi:octaprenyl-diphosphate synthase
MTCWIIPVMRRKSVKIWVMILAEGKPTLPLIYAMQHGTPAQAAVIRAAIEQGDINRFAEVLEIVQQTGALDYTRHQAKREADLASAELANVPDTQYKRCLLELAELAASRQA